MNLLDVIISFVQFIGIRSRFGRTLVLKYKGFKNCFLKIIEL